MQVVVIKEAAPERRVALSPPVVSDLVERGHAVAVERGAGGQSSFTDDAFRAAGADIVDDPLADAEAVLVVGPLTPEQAARIPVGATLVGFLDPFAAVDTMHVLADRRVTAFAMEAVPRTTLAQSMDAMSSQASAAGYHAVLLAGTASPRIFPMLITAAGTIAPVKLLVLGAGVAGLQAIATARRLGAVVSAYDVRPEVREQIESLGATFISAPVDESAAAASGHAKELADDTQRRQQFALSESVADADVVICTAQVPARPAPLLISREMVEQMRPGSVIVDVAAATGGNCELTHPGDDVVHGQVLVMGPTDLAGRVAVDASHMYARNLAAFIGRITDDEGNLAFDFDDEIVAETCITHDGDVVHPVTRRAMEPEEEQ